MSGRSAEQVFVDVVVEADHQRLAGDHGGGAQVPGAAQQRIHDLLGAFPLGWKRSTLLPLQTITLLADLMSSLAREAPSLRLAGTVSLMSTFLASMNLDALEQLVQLLRW